MIKLKSLINENAIFYKEVGGDVEGRSAMPAYFIVAANEEEARKKLRSKGDYEWVRELDSPGPMSHSKSSKWIREKIKFAIKEEKEKISHAQTRLKLAEQSLKDFQKAKSGLQRVK